MSLKPQTTADAREMVLAPQTEGIPVPRPGRFSAPYWDAAREGKLVYQRCAHCGNRPRKPTKTCGACLTDNLEWKGSAGRGSLYSWTVVWRPQHPAFTVPYAPAVIEMDEGWWLMTAMIGCRPSELREGMAVAIEFHPAGGDFWLPYARAEGTEGQ
jgi:uncharacterized OB-fold protein